MQHGMKCKDGGENRLAWNCHPMYLNLLLTLTTQPFNGRWSGTTRVGRYQKNTHPLTPVLIIGHPLSTSSIYYDPQHPQCSVYVLDSPL